MSTLQKRALMPGMLLIHLNTISQSVVHSSLLTPCSVLAFLYSGFEAGPLAEQLSIHTPIPIPYKAPIDWSKLGTIISLIPIVALVFRFIRPVIHNRWIWAAGTVLVSLIMTSGFMFTRIRGVPYAGNDGSWIAGGYQNQFGQEVQVVSMICKCFGTRPGQVVHIIITYRWDSGSFIPDADDRHAIPKVCCSTTDAGVLMDIRQFPRFFHLDIVISHQEQGYVSFVLLRHDADRDDQGTPSNSYFKRSRLPRDRVLRMRDEFIS